ncbi:MAG TPA: TIGR01212 family radical SAM protein [Candidatus Binatia bacterium]|nr:TIGR01212 family radical SAM protein [Candidatus Binatia bacterium]
MNFPSYLARRWGGKRYNGLNRALKDTFNARVHKVGIRMDFTCPNRDGTVAVGGCIYCNNASHTPQGFRAGASVTEQLAQGTAALRRRHRAEKFIAYFQSYSNTYGPPERLSRLYREALAFPGVAGLAVSTRPDCVPDDVLDLLAELSRETHLWLEMGLESMHDKTLRWVNRGHDLNDFIDAVARAKARGLGVCAHLILGFPDETRDEMLEAAALFDALGVDGVKLHNLHVIRHTALAEMYLREPFPLMSREEYADLVVDFLERLSPDILIHRLSGETYRALTVAPEWSIDKIGTHNAIQRALEARDAWQGRLFNDASSPALRASREAQT